MSKPQAPCLNCLDRYLTCHSKCIKYLEFKERANILKEEINKNKRFEYDLQEFKKAKYKRINKKR